MVCEDRLALFWVPCYVNVFPLGLCEEIEIEGVCMMLLVWHFLSLPLPLPPPQPNTHTYTILLYNTTDEDIGCVDAHAHAHACTHTPRTVTRNISEQSQAVRGEG